MSPEWRPFADAEAKKGRPNRGPRSETSITADSPSRSLSNSSRDHKLTRMLRLVIKQDGYLYLDLSQIINDGRIRTPRTQAIALARWILGEYNVSLDDNSKGKESKLRRRDKDI